MTKERLKEIKDSIDFQKQYTIYKGFDMDLLQEEIDLYEEVIKLQERIDKAIEYITTEQLYTNYQWGKSQYSKILKDLLEILRGEVNEKENNNV